MSNPNNAPIRVLLADDHQMVRAGLKSLLQSEPEVEVVGEAEEGRTAVRMAAELSPDIVVMDVNMPDLNGIEATRQIRNGSGGNGSKTPRVIGLSAHSDKRYASEMLKAGAGGYVLKDVAFEELLTALRSVVANKVYLSPRVTGVIVEEFVRGGGPGEAQTLPSPFTTLTGREREVLQLVAEGKSTKQVAMHLHISVKTVETHRRSMMEKLNMDSVAELTKYAIREGVTSLER